MIQVTHCYRISAAHVLSNPTVSEAENDAMFGKCSNPNGHGHDYEFEVTVGGEVDSVSGLVMAPGLLDEIFEETIGRRYSHHLLNACEAFLNQVPSTENLVRAVFQDLQPEVEGRSCARLVRVRVRETPRNIFEYGEPQ